MDFYIEKKITPDHIPIGNRGVNQIFEVGHLENIYAKKIGNIYIKNTHSFNFFPFLHKNSHLSKKTNNTKYKR